MRLFGYKNNSKEFLEFDEFNEKIKELLNVDDYISRKQYLNYKNELQPTYKILKSLEEQGVLTDWCKKNNTDYKKFIGLIKQYEDIEKIVDEHNQEFILNHLKSDKEYLDSVLKDDDPNIKLDDEQRKVVLSDEDYTLVIAGAGAGKTTTIEAKVKYLVDIKHIDPSRILVISFTKKATEELKDRFKKIGVNPETATFHSVGNTIIKQNEKEKHIITTPGFMFDSIKEYLTTKLDDKYFIKKILIFFGAYLNIPFDESNTELLFKTLKDNGISTMKADLKKELDEYKEKQTKSRRTLKDERVRSIDECRIANFLYINDIDYEYEPIYRYSFKGTIKPYCPDFLLKQGDKEVYLEHFGITESGKNNRFTPEELKEYKQHVNEKILLHREHNTKLIYTFSQYNDGKDLITHLERILLNEGFVFNRKKDEEIYKKIALLAEDKYFNKFVSLLCTFITRMKTSNFGLSKFDEWKINLKDERTKLFVEIAYQCYLAYSKALKDKNAIDFEDMINNASNILDKLYKQGTKLPYDYILVDEYQDISIQRFDLCEKLSKVSDAKIIAVGDDWQSIYRFSGSKIDLFTQFEKIMGYANILKITRTYRNSQELIDIAGGFVMENNKQIQKQLKSNKSIADPVIIVSYNDDYDPDNKDKGPLYHLAEAVDKSIDQIVLEHGDKKNILLIGRYGFDGRNLTKIEELFKYEDNHLVCIKHPNVHIDFMTAHSSKGLGYDNVIIINGKDGELGFPSKIEDDPIMQLVIKNDEELAFAEERRLFYVALTRTKNRVYIVAPQKHPSEFILEIMKHFTSITLRGEALMPRNNQDLRFACPICGYPLQKRSRNSFGFLKGNESLWICSNDPEVCGFVTNDIQGGKLAISKCPDCEDGYLVVKRAKDGNRFLGCTNFKSDGTGCKCTMSEDEYTQDLSKMPVRFYNNDTSIDLIYIAEKPVKELIFGILDILKEIAQRNLNMTANQLVNVVAGEDNKGIKTLNLDKLENFGMIDARYKNHIFRVINLMIIHGILKKKDDEYKSIYTVNDNPNDDEIKILSFEFYGRN